MEQSNGLTTQKVLALFLRKMVMMSLYIIPQSSVKVFKSLAEGDKVEFELVKDEKGFKATNVVKL